ncbi:cold shock domain-containing protein [Ramlibacter monticola]|uniref:Excalibur calcium-binding domain-containing protein n=1 Tax=Ramlibacter monticola TaxID=1926872 RepID=A0A937CVH5_9BURK|nr:excalibur calcium-binding domain-containing protein [Ramlibacter monticola]MBL0393709.1 excalibur calcium-binding domain-containing protein [Ramlibacter monticola]
MRFAGRLHDWNEQRGFGFIRPTAGGDDIFVHGSALPMLRPGPDEVLSFEVALDRQGRKKAVHVRRQADEASALATDRLRDAQRVERALARKGAGVHHGPGIVQGLVMMVITGVLAWSAYRAYGVLAARHPAPEQAVAERSAGPLQDVKRASASPFRCDGRTQCSQMTSCAEATFFLRNCPGTKMDGDGDGVPCEQQWCSAESR